MTESLGRSVIVERSDLLREARELLERQRSEERTLSDRHYAVHLQHEAVVEELRLVRSLNESLSSLSATASGGGVDALLSLTEADIDAEMQRLRERQARDVATLADLEAEATSAAELENAAGAELDGFRRAMDEFAAETRQMEALGDAAVRIEHELATARAERVSREQALRAATSDVNDLQSKAAASVQQRNILTDEIARCREQVARLSVTCAELEQSVALLDSRRSAIVDGFRSSFACLAKGREQLLERIAELEARDASGRAAIERARVVAGGAEAAMAAAVAAKAHVDSQLAILRQRDELAELTAARARYVVELRHLERQLQQRPPADELPSRCAALQRQCEALCTELGEANEDLLLLQCGKAVDRYSEMSMALDVYRGETLPAVRRRLADARSELHSCRESQRQWTEELERHDAYARVLDDDARRLRERAEVALRRRAANAAEEADWERLRRQWDEQRAAWAEEDRAVSLQIASLNDAAAAGTLDSDTSSATVVEVVEEVVSAGNVRTTKRHLIAQAPGTTSLVTAHAEPSKTVSISTAMGSQHSGHFDFFAVRLIGGLARMWRRGAGRSAPTPKDERMQI